ncbi:MAG: hypothetical protein HY343_12405 [Lentisphaerae bacterium]|nr:hypothetical protein [Lentisphaerota bacterium]
MSERTYKATLSQSQGREGWSVIFRHPVLLDRATGKPGRRVRRGLGTRDEKEAGKLIAELNQLLANPAFWQASSRPAALGKFKPVVVDIFYHDMVPEASDPAAVRDAIIPLPRSLDSPYRQVLLVGTTGGGKTTLVRQIIGSDPRTERFPSTSTAKTTVADTEIVLAPGPFRAVVTFLPRDQVRDYVEECMSAAVLAAFHGQSDTEILRRLLNHVNQRFRLSYILGTLNPAANADESDEAEEAPAVTDIPAFDLAPTRALVGSSLGRLRSIAQEHAASLRKELQATGDERVFEELFEDALDSRLREDERFQTLADAFIGEIERRFELLKPGTVEKTKQGWPRCWSYESANRGEFLKTVSRFSSNYAPYFGTLLTPLVNGIRVAGPFRPAWLERQPPLVLFDVEGLGPTPDSAASLPTSLTRRLEQADAVLLVDNATQPMQAAPVAAMRNLAAGGQSEKLMVCFTHFDGVTGDNLPDFKSREQHVLASAENALVAIGEQLGSFAERALRKRLESACFFLGGLHEPLPPETKGGKRTIAQLQELVRAIERIAIPSAPVPSRPVYERMSLVLHVKQAAEEFHAAWSARLGIAVKYGIPKEHWTRIKALARRFAEGWDDEYLNLKPLADLHKELVENIYRFIQNPVSWTGPVPSDDEKQQVFDGFARTISFHLLAIVAERMKDEVLRDWQRAYGLTGTGSTFVRAKIIASDVYRKAAPVPDVRPMPDGNKFLNDVIEAVRASAEEHQITLR